MQYYITPTIKNDLVVKYQIDNTEAAISISLKHDTSGDSTVNE